MKSKRNDILLISLLSIAALLWILPLWWIFMMSLKPNDMLQVNNIDFSFRHLTLSHYISLLKGSNTLLWLKNSAVVAFMMTFLTLVLSATAGYAFARIPFRGRPFIFLIILISFSVPEQAIFIPLHSLMGEFNMHNTLPALYMPRLAIPFGVFLMTQFFKGIPKDFEEAARLEGIGHWKIFTRIMLPLAVPALTTLAIFTFLYAWNDYLWPLVSATKTESYTITTGLASLQGNFAQTEGLGFLMASAIFASLPVLILYILFQRYLIRGVALNTGK